MTTITPTFVATLENALKCPIVVGIFEDSKLTQAAERLDFSTQGTLKKAIEANAFKGKDGESLTINAPSGTSYSAIVLIGLGQPSALNDKSAEVIGAKIYGAVAKTQSDTVAVDLTDSAISNHPRIMAYIASGALLRSWSFPKYKTKTKEDVKLKNMVFVTSDVSATQGAFAPLKALAEGVFLTRHVVSEPPNVLYPESMAKIAKDELKSLGIKVEVLDEKDMAKLGMHSLLGVGIGSEKESQLIVLQWMNGPKDQKPVAFVGKGVTFDTGGISIKPSNNMEDMKYDLSLIHI
jgi:leucyl aminopeptidase